MTVIVAVEMMQPVWDEAKDTAIGAYPKTLTKSFAESTPLSDVVKYVRQVNGSDRDIVARVTLTLDDRMWG